jgi:hypothetical protein
MFLIDIPFKGWASRIVRPLCLRCHILPAVSLTPQACVVHAVLMAQQAFSNFLHNKAVSHMIFTFQSCSTILFCKFEFIFEKAFKNEDRKSRDNVLLISHNNHIKNS